MFVYLHYSKLMPTKYLLTFFQMLANKRFYIFIYVVPIPVQQDILQVIFSSTIWDKQGKLWGQW